MLLVKAWTIPNFNIILWSSLFKLDFALKLDANLGNQLETKKFYY